MKLIISAVLAVMAGACDLAYFTVTTTVPVFEDDPAFAMHNSNWLGAGLALALAAGAAAVGHLSERVR